jgi:hypothetical protein
MKASASGSHSQDIVFLGIAAPFRRHPTHLPSHAGIGSAARSTTPLTAVTVHFRSACRALADSVESCRDCAERFTGRGGAGGTGRCRDSKFSPSDNDNAAGEVRPAADAWEGGSPNDDDCLPPGRIIKTIPLKRQAPPRPAQLRTSPAEFNDSILGVIRMRERSAVLAQQQSFRRIAR